MLRGSVFVGREAELSLLEGELSEALHGQTRAVVLSGPPGVGKTSLAQRVARLGTQAGCVVAWARSWELGGAPAYWPWTQLLRELRAHLDPVPASLDDELLGPVLPELAHAAIEPARNDASFALFDAIRGALSEVAQAAPLLLILDDIHAADPSSLRLASFLQSSLRRAPILLVATHRDSDTPASDPAALAEVMRRARQIAVPPLDRPSVAKLIEAHLGDGRSRGGTAIAEALCRRTGGNPLFLTGLLESVRGDAALESLREGAGRIPATIRAALEPQLSYLDADARQVLQHAAMLRRDLSLELLARVCARSPAQVEGIVATAVERRVLVRLRHGAQAQPRWGFAHDLFADVLQLQVAPESRAAFHLRIARALEDTLSDAALASAEVARHFRAAGAPEAFERTVLAGQQATRVCAYDTAAGLFRTALHVASLEAERARAQLGLADALRLAGHVSEAMTVYARVRGDANAIGRAAIGASRCVEFSVPHPGVIATLEAAIESVGGGDLGLSIELYNELAQRLWTSPNDGRMEGVARELAALDPSSLAPPARHALLVGRFYARWSPHHVDERARIVGAMQAQLPRLETPLRLEVHRYALNLAWERCDGARAERELALYAEAALTLRSEPLAVNVLLRRCVSAQHRGDFAGVGELLDEMRSLHERLEDPLAEFYQVAANALAWIERDQGPELVAHLAMVEQTVASRWSSYPGASLSAYGIAALLGLRERLVSPLAEARACGFAMNSRWSLVQAYGFHAEAALVLDDLESARLLLERAEGFAELNAQCGPMLPLGPLCRQLGRLAARLGQLERAENLLRRACELCERLGCIYWLAYSRVELADVLDGGGGGAPAEIRALRRSAAAMAREHDWPRLLSRSQSRPGAEIRELGGARPDESRLPPHSGGTLVTLARKGEVWTLRVDKLEVQLRTTKGLAHIATLVARPHQPLPALTLMGAHAGASTGGAELLDERAIASYRERAHDLNRDIAEAEARNDLGWLERARAELEALTDELVGAAGLGGRRRRATSDAERARSAVTQAVRRAIKKIEAHQPTLAHHLRNSIRTGAICVYAPEPGSTITWSASQSS